MRRDSGGRTSATFRRARLLERDHEIWILTFDFKIDYRSIYSEWCSRYGASTTVEMKNFIEALAGEPIYHDDPSTAFVPPADARRAGPQSWTRDGQDGAVKVFRLREDGSLRQRDTVRDGALAVAEHFDSGGRRRVRELWRDGKVVRCEYFTDEGRRFLTTRIDERGREKFRVEGGAYDTGGDFFLPVRLRRQWAAALEDERERVVFVLDDRAHDRVFLPADREEAGVHERLRSKIVVVVHSTHLAPPHDDVHQIRPRNGDVLARQGECDATVVLTHEQQQDIAEHFGADGLTVIPHPVRAGRSDGRTHRAKKRVVMAARLVTVKRFDHMIRAFGLVAQEHPDAEFHIWGDGYRSAEMKGLAHELGLSDRIVFQGYTTDVAGALRTGVVSMSASEREGFGLATIEAMSAGLPVVSYAYKYGPRDVIRDGRNGFVVPNGDVEALAERVSWLLSHPVRRRIMGLRARLAPRKFRPHVVRRQWRDLLDRIE